MDKITNTPRPVSPERQRLHRIFVDALGERVCGVRNLTSRPFTIDIKASFESKVNVYLYPAINPPGGRHASEYKVNLLLQNHKPRTRGNFDFSNYPLLVAYSEEFDVYILLDAFAHRDFTPNTNVQFRDDVIFAAMLHGTAYMEKDNGEIVIAATARHLIDAIYYRLFDLKPKYGIS